MVSCTLAEVVSTEWIKPGVLVYTDMHLHTVGAAPLSVDTTGYLFGLVHLWVPFTGFVFGGTGSRDQGGIDDRALLHGHALLLEVGLDRFENLLAEVVLLKQVPEAENRCLIRDSIADQIDPSKAADGPNLDQRILHGWITEAVPLLHQVNTEHCGQWVRRTATFAAGLWVVRLDQINKCLPRHNLIHLGPVSPS